MPTALILGPYRFFFYSGDRNEPLHVHVERSDYEAKFWLDPIRLQSNYGFNRREINRIERLVIENKQRLVDKWYEHFSD